MMFAIIFLVIFIAYFAMGVYGCYVPSEDERFRYAGFWLRFWAGFIDWAILVIANVLIGFLFGYDPLFFEYDSPTQEGSLAHVLIGFLFGYDPLLLQYDSSIQGGSNVIFGEVIAIVGTWLYYILMESSKYRGTLGKMAVGIQIVDMNGNQISFGRATGRLLATIPSVLTLVVGGFGYFMMGWTKQKQALHDKIASCLVIRKGGQKTLTQDQPPGQENRP